MPFSSGFEDETAIAIGALHEVLVAHLEIHFGMAERAAYAVARDLGVFDFNDFGSINRHAAHFLMGSGEDHIRQACARKRFARRAGAG